MGFATSKIKNNLEKKLDFSRFYRKLSFEEIAIINKQLVSTLKIFDLICREAGLQYALVAGALIGAMRDGHCIPWDDDIDLVMPRKDYESFRSALMRSEYRDRYEIKYPEENTVITMGAHFYEKDVCLRNLISDEIGTSRIFEDVIYLDILPIDYCPDSELSYKLVGSLVNMLQMGYISRRCFRANDPYINYLAGFDRDLKANLLLRKAFSLPFFLLGKKNIFRILKKLLSCSQDTARITVAFGALRYFGETTPADVWLPTSEAQLEGCSFMAPNKPEEYLINRYGDYTTIPSREEQEERMVRLRQDWEDYIYPKEKRV